MSPTTRRSHRTWRAAAGCLAGLAIGVTVLPAAAAVQRKITVSGGGLPAPIEIVEPQELLFYPALCSEQPAGDLVGRPAYDLVDQWTDEMALSRSPRQRALLSGGDQPIAGVSRAASQSEEALDRG